MILRNSHSAFALLLIVLSAGCVQSAVLTEDYMALLNDRFENYSTIVRPVLDQTDVTRVLMNVHLLSIMEVKEQEQTLVTNIRLEIQWYDFLLAWINTSYGPLTDRIFVPQEELWLPDIVLANPVSEMKRLGHDDLLVRVRRNGRTNWQPTGVFETACDIDVTYYPFDTQRCTILFQTEMSTRHEVHIFADGIDLGTFAENGQWELLDQSVKDTSDCVNVDVPCVMIQLELKRRRFFYILNIILPVVFLSLTSSLVFALPADAGEKMGLSITVLLAYAVYLTLVSDAMPNTSMQASIVAVYLMMLLGLCAINVVLTVFILRLHHREEPIVFHRRLSPLFGRVRKVLRYKDHNQQEKSIVSAASPSTDTTSFASLENADNNYMDSEKHGSHGNPFSSTAPSTQLSGGRSGAKWVKIVDESSPEGHENHQDGSSGRRDLRVGDSSVNNSPVLVRPSPVVSRKVKAVANAGKIFRRSSVRVADLDADQAREDSNAHNGENSQKDHEFIDAANSDEGKQRKGNKNGENAILSPNTLNPKAPSTQLSGGRNGAKEVNSQESKSSSPLGTEPSHEEKLTNTPTKSREASPMRRMPYSVRSTRDESPLRKPRNATRPHADTSASELSSGDIELSANRSPARNQTNNGKSYRESPVKEVSAVPVAGSEPKSSYSSPKKMYSPSTKTAPSSKMNSSFLTTGNQSPPEASPNGTKQKPFSNRPNSDSSVKSDFGEGDKAEGVSGKIVAETLDFLLFLTCTILSIGTTVLCILVLVVGSSTGAINTSLV